MVIDLKGTRFIWFGQPRIELRGNPVKFETRKALALLAYVSVSDRPISRESLAAMFWPEFDRERAPANLRRTLSSAVADLGHELILADRDMVTIAKSPDLEVDAVSTRRIVGLMRVHAHGSSPLCPECRANLDRLMALYQGEFMEGFNLKDAPLFDEWQDGQRDALRGEFAYALDQAHRSSQSAGDWEEALVFSKRRAALDRFDEKARRSVMLSLARSGQPGLALKYFEDFESFLADELGQAPSSETISLARDIRDGKFPSEQRGEKQRPGLQAPVKPDIAILKTKLFMPTCPDRLVERTRLASELAVAATKGLTVILAPAGFGKSTLATQWARNSGQPVSWLSLDEDDNDPSRFLVYLVAAIATSIPGIGAETIEMLKSARSMPKRGILASLIGDIEASGKNFALILDDCQFIKDREVAELLSLLVERIPGNLSLILLSRADPALPLARLRAQGKLTELRSDDLRFTEKESSELFDLYSGRDLSRDEKALLTEKTEGWIAGLKLAALSLRGSSDVRAFVRDFSGSNRYILDYLMEEVFDRLGEATRGFLLASSIVERFRAELCEVLSGSPGGEDFLDELERSGLFLIPLDEERKWYRYHHLFSELLRHRLLRDRGHEGLARLHAIAALWLEKNGSPDEAIRHYMACGDFSKAGELVVRETQRMVSQGLISVVLKWADALPERILADWPELSFQKAKGLIFAGRIEEAFVALGSLESSLANVPEGGRKRRLESYRDGTKAFLAFMKRDMPAALALAQASIAGLEASDFEVLGAAYWIVLAIHHAASQWEAADRVFAEYTRLVMGARDSWSYAFAGSEYAFGLKHQGRLGDAETLYYRILDFADKQGAGAYLSLATIYSGLADLKRERGELKNALWLAEEGVRRAEGWQSATDLANAYLVLAAVHLSASDYSAASIFIEKAKGMIVSTAMVPGMDCVARTLEAKLICRRGDSSMARPFISALAKEKAPGRGFIEMLTIAETRLLILTAEEEPEGAERAVALLELWISEAVALGRFGRAVEMEILHSLASNSLGKKTQALEHLGRALAMAFKEGFTRVFLDEGDSLLGLLAEGRWENAALDSYASRLLGLSDAIPREP